jgi:hypothetical protein
MTVSLGKGHAAIRQPCIHLGIAFEPQPRREEAFTDQADLILDLPLLPPRRWCARHRFDQIMPAHLLEAPIISPLAPDKDRIDRRLHVVVDAALAGPAEEGERPVVRVEHHLLAFTRIALNEEHPAVTQPHVRDFHRRRDPGDHCNLMAPVELIGFARIEAQRHSPATPAPITAV